MVGGNWTLATAYRYLGRIDEEKLDFAGEISGIFTKNHMIIAKIIAYNPYYFVGWAMPTLPLLRRCKICDKPPAVALSGESP